jgi:hypothetical protein
MHKLAYINGVLHGDGWCKQALGLRVKDYDFCETFANAVNIVEGLNKKPRLDERGYWLFRVSNKTGKFDHLLHFEPSNDNEYAAWVRGLFDSEGNAQLTPLRISPNSFHRRIAIYSTEVSTLNKASLYLTSLDIPTTMRATKSSAGHKGTKTVYELKVRSSRNNFQLFSEKIGSSIKRKQIVLNAIPSSYHPDFSQHCREAQLKGAAAKHYKLMTETVPNVVKGIRALIDQGIKPTQRACRIIPGFNSIQRYFSQAKLVSMAMDL